MNTRLSPLLIPVLLAAAPGCSRRTLATADTAAHSSHAAAVALSDSSASALRQLSTLTFDSLRLSRPDSAASPPLLTIYGGRAERRTAASTARVSHQQASVAADSSATAVTRTQTAAGSAASPPLSRLWVALVSMALGAAIMWLRLRRKGVSGCCGG